MHNDTGVELKNPGVPREVRDALTEILRHGAHQLLTQAIETDVAEYLTRYRDAHDEAGGDASFATAPTVQTGIGAVPVKAPRV